MKRLLTLMVIGLSVLGAAAQIIRSDDRVDYADSLRREYDRGPYFSLYKDNYFTVGMPLGQRVTAANSGVKFQLSIQQRLTKSVLPWHTYLFLMYTQKTVWNVFQESLPMRDINFNPGIGLTKPFFSKDRYVGKLTMMIEHESNGRDDDDSRSWNKISFSGQVVVDPQLLVHAKFWIPIIDSANNKDILKYSGIFQWGFLVKTLNEKWQFGLTAWKRAKWNPLAWNTQIDICWRPWKKANEYFYIQYYQGYGQYLRDYNKYQSNIWFGFVIKPRFFSEF